MGAAPKTWAVAGSLTKAGRRHRSSSSWRSSISEGKGPSQVGPLPPPSSGAQLYAAIQPRCAGVVYDLLAKQIRVGDQDGALFGAE